MTERGWKDALMLCGLCLWTPGVTAQSCGRRAGRSVAPLETRGAGLRSPGPFPFQSHTILRPGISTYAPGVSRAVHRSPGGQGLWNMAPSPRVKSFSISVLKNLGLLYTKSDPNSYTQNMRPFTLCISYMCTPASASVVIYFKQVSTHPVGVFL